MAKGRKAGKGRVAVPAPVRVHPANPKYLEFRGRATALITATEHYGAVMNRPFRFERYLADAADRGMTLTRLFVLFRELQTAHNPYSTCKPESTDYIAPFARTGPGLALDGLPRYNLDVPNPEFVDRLHAFIGRASDLGIVVEVTLLSNTYCPEVWALNPLNAVNNLNGLPEIRWPEYMSLHHRPLFERQVEHVRRIVQETSRYDNVIYEVCNEPGGGLPGHPDHPSVDEVNAWLVALATEIRCTDRSLGGEHMVVGQEAFQWAPFVQLTDRSFRDMPLDVVNVHPLPDTDYRGRRHDMGAFMSKQLRLRELRDFCLATWGEPKPLNLDEDNAASRFLDMDGWTIHRKRAWTAVLSGAHYDVIDFSIQAGREAGTRDSRRCIRSWIGHLSRFVHSMDLTRARPQPDALRGQPDHTVGSVLAVPGEDYAVYLADGRELSEPDAGAPIVGEVALDLPDGTYTLACYSPTTGLCSPGLAVVGGRESAFSLPEFVHDIVLRLQRE